MDPTIETIVMSESRRGLPRRLLQRARRGAHAYGNPFHQTGTFVIDSGPAELEGLSGTSDVSFAGAALRGVYSIDLE